MKKRKREKAGDSNENPFPENQDTETTNTENKDNNNTKTNNPKKKVNNNIYKDYIDDDKRTSSNEGISPISHNDDMINLNSVKPYIVCVNKRFNCFSRFNTD